MQESTVAARAPALEPRSLRMCSLFAVAAIVSGLGCRANSVSQEMNVDSGSVPHIETPALAAGDDKNVTQPVVAAAAAENPATTAVAAIPEQLPPCATAGLPDDIGWMVAPAKPHAGAPLVVLAASLGSESELGVVLVDAAEKTEGPVRLADQKLQQFAGVPAYAVARWQPSAAGRVTAMFFRGAELLGCETIRVRSKAATVERLDTSQTWKDSRSWTIAEEALYSAWIRHMFDAPDDQALAYSALHEVTRSPERNLLHGMLGYGEDDAQGLKLVPDCADTPYFFRAYWAWKRQLPFVFYQCSRGTFGKAPTCRATHTNRDVPEMPKGEPTVLSVIDRFFRKTLAWGVHTGNGRVALDDSKSALYAVDGSRRSLRPGTVYADPYGHILMLAQWVDRGPQLPGILWAVDGQPDGSLTRKRFWPGNFLWNSDPRLGGSGFKNFRPVVPDVDGELRVLTNSELAKSSTYDHPRASTNYRLSSEAFYDDMDRLIGPVPRDLTLTLRDVVASLVEQLEVRVTSIENGRKWLQTSKSPAEMPIGAAVFETTGAWEDYSTPARDLRILVAMDVVAGLPKQVERQPELFGLTTPEQIAAAKIRATKELAEILADPKIGVTYLRSDGSSWFLPLSEILARSSRFEMAYNPNDCPEIRWGADAGSKEMSSCKSHAPAPQRQRMQVYRPWFSKRERPARGQVAPQ